MKGQVLHRARAHLKVPGWLLVWNELWKDGMPKVISNFAVQINLVVVVVVVVVERCRSESRCNFKAHKYSICRL